MSRKPFDPDVPLVLVVEDDEPTRMLLRRALEREGYHVEEAGDGMEALRCVEQFAPDLILMDAVMPVMDGFTACKKLRALPGAAGIPVLIVTALDDEKSVNLAFDCGASDYIHKPIRWPVLRQRMRRMLNEYRADRHINHIAHHDSLTDLPNRRLFSEQLEQRTNIARRKGQPLALLFLDLDRFKLINDTLGHDVGDLLIQAVAKRLAEEVRRGDLVARLGGDEFTIITEGVNSAEDAVQVAEKMLKVLSLPFTLSGREVFVTASIGIALYPFDGADSTSLMKNADAAMYRAKEHGRNSYQFYTAEMSTRAMQRLALEGGLRRALERDEFVLYYQPQVNITTGLIIGVEALIRWNHPELSLVPPGDFIPLAEDTGMIVPIGEWVLRAACRQHKLWCDAGYPPIRVTVNLSGRQFRQQALAETIRDALTEFGITAAALGVEITESSIMHNDNLTKSILIELDRMGVHLSLDDFGTGYSSLSYLKSFPIGVLKIDRSFVRDVTTDSDDAAIATAIIAMAHSLKMGVIAEGVETMEQLEFLRRQGCDAVQGYLIGRPVPAAEFAKLLHGGNLIRAADAR